MGWDGSEHLPDLTLAISVRLLRRRIYVWGSRF